MSARRYVNQLLKSLLPVIFLVPVYCGSTATTTDSRPNILLIMADDMGYSDIGCFGSEIKTPNIDALAERGLRFTQFYNCARCNPTRASLLTGLYPHQAGMGFATGDLGLPGYQGKLSDDCVTIAEVLRGAGYRTLMSGKWHLGDRHPHWPVDRGFDHHWGLIDGAANYFRPEQPLALDDQVYTIPDSGFYMTDATTDYAVSYIREYGLETQPFFLYVAYTAPHWPLHAWPEDIAKYRGKYRQGWEHLRRTRQARMIEMGLVQSSWALPDMVPKLDWDALSDQERDMWDLKMSVYAAQIDRMDQGIGRILKALQETGADKKTIIFFLSDNGACQVEVDRGKPGVPPGPVDSYLAYGPYWAQSSNTPFRRYKQYTEEGGISTPLIVTGPGVSVRGGSLTNQVGLVIDMMPTCLELGGTTYPVEFNSHAVKPVEGISLVPIFRGEQRKPHDVLYWEHTGHRGVREGDWKLVADRGAETWRLYDERKDRTELHDLSGERPELAQRLLAMWEKWAKDSGVEPWEKINNLRRQRHNR